MRELHNSILSNETLLSGPNSPNVLQELDKEAQNPPRNYLKVAELCEELRITPRTAYLLLSKGEMPHVRVGRSIRIYRDALDEWRREQERASKK